MLISPPPRAKREGKKSRDQHDIPSKAKVLGGLDQPPRAKREVQVIIVNLPAWAEREAEGENNLFFRLGGFDYVDLIFKMSDICPLLAKRGMVICSKSIYRNPVSADPLNLGHLQQNHLQQK